MSKLRDRGGTAALLLCLAFGAPAAIAADSAAEINLLTGKGTASSPEGGGVRNLAKGDRVFTGDVVSSGPNSYVNLKFRDGAFVLIRPNSRFQIEDYQYPVAAPPKPTIRQPAPEAQPAPPPLASSSPTTTRAFFRLLKGGFRAVSGLIGKSERADYRVATPVATIGIRGTDYSAVICDAACANDPVVRSQLTEDIVAEGGLIAGVTEGAIAVDSAGRNCDRPKEKGECLVGKSQYLLVSRDGEQVRLETQPHFLEVDPTPNPQTCAP